MYSIILITLLVNFSSVSLMKSGPSHLCQTLDVSNVVRLETVNDRYVITPLKVLKLRTQDVDFLIEVKRSDNLSSLYYLRFLDRLERCT